MNGSVRYRHERFGDLQTWAAICADRRLAVVLWCRDYNDPCRWGTWEKTDGGIEIHEAVQHVNATHNPCDVVCGLPCKCVESPVQFDRKYREWARIGSTGWMFELARMELEKALSKAAIEGRS